MTVTEMLDKIRKIVSETDGDEKDVMEALVVEAEGWRLRLQELEGDE